MKKQQREADEQNRRVLAERSEQVRELLRRGADPTAPAVTPMTIEEQIALGIPLDTGWIGTMPLPSRRRKAAKP